MTKIQGIHSAALLRFEIVLPYIYFFNFDGENSEWAVVDRFAEKSKKKIDSTFSAHTFLFIRGGARIKV